MAPALKLGIGGLGAIGLTVARKVDAGEIPGLTLVAVSARDQDKARARIAGFKSAPKLVSLAGLAEEADVILEGIPAAYFAEIAEPTIELSPGTLVLHDVGYAKRFPELIYQPAACVMTRVISQPTSNRLTLDLGHKAIAADPPAGQRFVIHELPNAVVVNHSEEHVVLQTDHANRYRPGDCFFAWPTHICPTCALHREAYVVENGEVRATWQIASRDRV